MYHIAVVEDENECSKQIQTFLTQYQEENNVRFKVSVFESGTRLWEVFFLAADTRIKTKQSKGSS